MKRFFLAFSLLCFVFLLAAQTKTPKKKRFIKSWHIEEQLAMPDTVPMDTSKLNFQDRNIIDKFSISNSYNANYGSPIQSRIYMDRPRNSDFMFENAFKPYLMDVSSALFYDTTFPFTNLTYLTGGPTGRKEDQVKFLFTASPSKRLNFGTNLDYFYSEGQYANQAAKRFSGSIFARYNGKHYSFNALVAANNHFHHENGGLSNLDLINNPTVDVQPKDMPTYMHAYEVFNKNLIYYNQNYSIGINREKRVNKDSVTYEYIPVTRFGHTIKYEEMKNRYYEPALVTNFYDNTYLYRKNQTIANDTAALKTLENVFSVNLAEEFNKWMHFGLTAFVENEVQQFTFMPDTVLNHVTKSNTSVGGVLSKQRGTKFTYEILGNIYLIGYKLGDFKINGNVNGNFNIGKENIVLKANAFLHNEEPSYFIQHYYSTHFKWDNDFNKIRTTHIEGTFELPKRKTKLNLAVENITNYVYFNDKAIPTQNNGNIQVLSANLKQDVSVGHFTLENNIVYQTSSNQDALPLPALTLFHNLYYHGKWFKDLYPQLGLNVRYYTNYYAPSFMPATSQFYNQKSVTIGNYPVINAYANFHLKQARFFFEYTNISAFILKGYGMLMPNYPVNPPMFKMGISWNFYN